MADIRDKKTRSYNMSQIRSRDTKPELVITKYLHSRGLRYRLYDKKLPGKPDLVFRKYKTVVFVNGCFWHGHKGCRYFKIPKTRSDWWEAKINATKERDFQKTAELEKAGWNVITIWECDLKGDSKEKNLDDLYRRLI